ncbi:MAG TPA: hypothetical protein VF661_05015 [Actinomycetales bacterium]|jgi:hypothetical protein
MNVRANVVDRIRIERAVQSYGWWLDLRGANGRRRRELRAELRANLVEAADRSSAVDAVAALGSTRAMAADALPADPSRARWLAGAQAGVAALALTLMVEMLMGLAWLDGAMASGSAGTVTGSLTLFPGSQLSYSSPGGGLVVSVSPGWLCLVAGLLVTLVVARPWRTLRAARQPRAVSLHR